MKEGLDYKETAGWKLAEHLERLKEFERRNRPRRGGSRGERSVPPGTDPTERSGGWVLGARPKGS